MALTVEQLEIIIDARVDGALKGFKKVEVATSSFQKNAMKMAKTFAGPLVGLAFIKTAFKMGDTASKLAAVAEEQFSKFNVVFGDSAKEVQEWADIYSESIGRSESDTLGFLASIGDLLKPLGFAKDAVDEYSKVVVTLANDLGSFNDMPTEAVLRDIQSAMVGNFEVTKKYGVVLSAAIIKQEAMNQGLYSGKGALDAQTKANIALQLFIKGTADAQGDLLKTQGSATNTSIRLAAAQKDLGIVIGQSINESITPMKAAIADLITEWTSYITITKEARDLHDSMTEGTGVTATSIANLTAELEDQQTMLKNLIITQKGLGQNNDKLDAQVLLQQENVKQLKSQIEAQVKLKFLADERKTAEEGLTDAQRLQDGLKIVAAQNRLDEARADEQAAVIAISRQKALNDAFGKTHDGQVASLKASIAFFKTFTPQGPMATAILTQLNEQLASLNGTTEEAIPLIEGVMTAEMALAQQQQEQADILTGRQENRARQAEEEKQDLDDRITKYQDFGTTIQGFVQGPLEALGAALIEGNVGWDTFAKAGITAIAEVVRSLGTLAVAQAAIRFATGDFVGGAAFTAAAAGAFVAAGAIQATASKFAEGGKFRTNGPTPIIVGDNAGGQEDVTITPVSSPNINGPSGGNGIGILKIGEREFRAFMQDEFDNGNLRIPRRIIV